MQALERRIEYLEHEVARLKSEKTAESNFTIGVEVEGNLYKNTTNSKCIEKILLINEVFSLNVPSDLPVEKLYSKLYEAAQKVIGDKYVYPAEAEIDRVTRKQSLENEADPIKFQTAHKNFTMDISKVQIIPHNIILPCCGATLSERGLDSTKSLKVKVSCRLIMEWYIKREKRHDRKNLTHLKTSSERTLSKSSKRRSRIFSKFSV